MIKKNDPLISYHAKPHWMRVAFLFTFIAVECLFTVKAAERVKVTIPTKDQVGALNLPDKIVPVKAPFAMPEFKKPIFPSLTVNIVQNGAKENLRLFL
jgi:hypothetical protein